jgi:hypothetical protein
VCPIEINSTQMGGIYVDGAYRVLPYTVESGEKHLITQKHPLGFRYWVFGVDRGGYYMEATNHFNPKIEVAPDSEVHLGQINLTGRKKSRGHLVPLDD